MRQARLAVIALLLTVATLASADESDLGGPGESCRARSDCKHGLKCVANVCADEHDGQSCEATSDCGTLKCIGNRCVNPIVAPPPTQRPQVAPPVTVPVAAPPAPVQREPERPPSHALEDWLRFDDRGAHAFVGLTFGVGFINGGYTASQGSLWGTGVDAAVLAAIRGGIVFNGRHELALEIAPFTYFWDATTAPGPAFEANASYGYLLPLLKSPKAALTWPFRVGIGVVAGGTNTNNEVVFEARVDVIGVSLRIGHVTLELHAPSFRYGITSGHVATIALDSVTIHWLSFLFGTSASYTF